MLVSRLLKLLFCVMFLVCPLVGCGTSVDTSPAVGDGTSGGEATDGMAEQEAEEFEAGERGQ